MSSITQTRILGAPAGATVRWMGAGVESANVLPIFGWPPGAADAGKTTDAMAAQALAILKKR